jgi:branched-chain amino acid transport system permease protein
VYLFAGLTVLVALRLKYSTHGRAYLSIREDEVAAEAMGIKTTRYKVQAFVISAFFAGIAGALTAASQGTINASELAFMRSLEIVVIIVLGGLGSVSGAIIAAVVLTYLPELLQAEAFARYRLILYSIILIAVMILRPKGLLGTMELWDVFKRRKRVTS